MQNSMTGVTTVVQLMITVTSGWRDFSLSIQVAACAFSTMGGSSMEVALSLKLKEAVAEVKEAVVLLLLQQQICGASGCKGRCRKAEQKRCQAVKAEQMQRLLLGKVINHLANKGINKAVV